MFRFFGFLLGLTVFGVGANAAPKQVECSEFAIPTDTTGVNCWLFDVAERHDAPTGRAITLAVAILDPVEENGPPDPLVMAQGGPGGATIGTYARYLLERPEARPTRDRSIVLWDQRGTGYSTPRLSCPEMQEAELKAASGGPDTQGSAEEDALAACGARLIADGVDLSAYNSVENARDVEAIRRAFGFSEINFYGVSYGSELAQFVIRELGGAVRSAVLDAVVPISYDLLLEPARAQQMIGEKYLLGCREDARCDAAFPDLAERYIAMIDRLNDEPVPLTIYPLEGERREIKVQLTGDLFEAALFSALYSNVSSLAPLIVDRADKGDFALTTAVLLPSQLGTSDLAEAMHLSVVCAERSKTTAQPDFTGILPRLVQSTLEDAAMTEKICDAWGVRTLPAELVAPVISDVPVLLISGAFDPITPPYYAEKLLPQFSAAHHVVFPDGTHGQAVTNPCANAIIGGFLTDPKAAPATDCVPDAAPRTVTDDDVIFVGLLNRSIASSGIMGIATAAMSQLPAMIMGVLLLVAWLVYPLVWLARKVSGHARAIPTEGHHLIAAAAPWLTVGSGVAILATIAALSGAVAVTLMKDEFLGIMGAIPRAWAPVLALPWLVAGLVVVMAVVAFLLWKHRLRSIFGRIGFTLITLGAAIGALNLVLIVQ